MFRLIFFLILASISISTIAQDGKELVGKEAPAIRFEKILQGEASDMVLGKKITIVNFWAKWCKPCQEEIPVLNQFYKENKENIQVIGITAHYRPGEQRDTNRNLKLIEKNIRTRKIVYPLVLDDGIETSKAYKALQLPTTVLIDESGKILDYRIGVKGSGKIMKKAKKLAES